MEKIKLALGYQFYFDVLACNNSGGLCLLWNGLVDLVVVSSCKYIIRTQIRKAAMPTSNASFFYGSPYRQSKEESWSHLKDVKRTSIPSLIIADPNVILHQCEKRGGDPFDYRESQFSREIINTQGLIDLGFFGNQFTWSNGWKNKANIKQRLDRALVNTDWLLMYPNAKLVYLPRIQSDHCPIILYSQPPCPNLPRQFRFQAKWITHPEYPKIITPA